MKMVQYIFAPIVFALVSLVAWQFIVVPLGNTMADSGYYREDRAHNWPHGWAGGLKVDKQKHLPEGTTYDLWKKHRITQVAFWTKQRLVMQAKQEAALHSIPVSASKGKL